ncbi:STAS/SEC14 domain-containing protein (plasmid) [Pseudoalteromonas sp. T1lg65]|uniref:STAS/SEC14 domain-containing protein n=1 Tax=Pseudoalteromonas sp. T1lg65 TaxID=2077101 RepID=UPI003F798371
MSDYYHGISVGTERHGDDIYFCLKPTGKLTHKDYEVIIPMIERAIDTIDNPNIHAFIDGTEFVGWEPRALWDDFKFGLKHGSEFKKIAIFGHKDWQKVAASIGNWFVSGEVKFFEDKNAALQWLKV